MNRRTRLPGALLALTAFTAYIAESATVRLCTSDPQQHELAVVDHDPTGSDHSGHTAGAAHTGAPESSGTPTSHEPHCPLGMAGGTSCVAISMPAVSDAVTAAPASYEAPFIASQVGHDLMVVRALYRPPAI